MDREDVLAYRIAAQQLDRPAAKRAVTDAAILDFGCRTPGGTGRAGLWSIAAYL